LNKGVGGDKKQKERENARTRNTRERRVRAAGNRETEWRAWMVGCASKSWWLLRHIIVRGKLHISEQRKYITIYVLCKYEIRGICGRL